MPIRADLSPWWAVILAQTELLLAFTAPCPDQTVGLTRRSRRSLRADDDPQARCTGPVEGGLSYRQVHPRALPVQADQANGGGSAIRCVDFLKASDRDHIYCSYLVKLFIVAI